MPRLSLIERYSLGIFVREYTKETTVVGSGIEASEVDWVTGLGEVHANGLPGVEGLETAFEVIQGRLSISGSGGLFGEVEGALGVVVILRARADNICI